MLVKTTSIKEQSGNIHMKKQLRPAIAMIELIFALVIMGITLLSAPLILKMSVQSSNTAMQQESISAVASELGLILTKSWDEGDTNATTGYGILRVTDGDSDLNITNRRTLDVNTSYSRRYNTGAQRQFASLPNTFGNGNILDAFDNNDIDDYHNVTRNVKLYNNSEESNLSNNEGEYLKGKNFTLTTSITYGDDTAVYTNPSVAFNSPFSTATANTSTNIKLIRVVLTDDTGELEHNQTISLYGFACNIGNAVIRPVAMD